MIKGVTQTIENEAKSTKGWILCYAALDGSVLGNILAGKEVIREGEAVIRIG